MLLSESIFLYESSGLTINPEVHFKIIIEKRRIHSSCMLRPERASFENPQ